MEQHDRLLKLLFGFSGKTNDDVSRQTDRPLRGLHPRDAREVIFAGVFPEHCLQHSTGTALYRQMHVIAQSRRRLDGMDNVSCEVAWMGSRETHSADSWDFRYGHEQFCKCSLTSWIAVRIHVLAEELNLAVSAVGKAASFLK